MTQEIPHFAPEWGFDLQTDNSDAIPTNVRSKYIHFLLTAFKSKEFPHINQENMFATDLLKGHSFVEVRYYDRKITTRGSNSEPQDSTLIKIRDIFNSFFSTDNMKADNRVFNFVNEKYLKELLINKGFHNTNDIDSYSIGKRIKHREDVLNFQQVSVAKQFAQNIVMEHNLQLTFLLGVGNQGKSEGCGCWFRYIKYKDDLSPLTFSKEASDEIPEKFAPLISEFGALFESQLNESLKETTTSEEKLKSFCRTVSLFASEQGPKFQWAVKKINAS